MSVVSPLKSVSGSRVEALRLAYGHLDAVDLLTVMIKREFVGNIAVTSSFGAEAAVLLDLVAQVDAATPVIFIDTDALFDETIEYREKLVRRLGLADIRIVRPLPEHLAQSDELWRTDPDTCCKLRKVQPLARASAGCAALIDGRKGFHGGQRSDLHTISEGAGGVIKVSPLARWGGDRIEAAFTERKLPRHPLVEKGFRSIGCWPCTRAVQPGEDVRAGRWAGQGKSECGIHTFIGGEGI